MIDKHISNQKEAILVIKRKHIIELAHIQAEILIQEEPPRATTVTRIFRIKYHKHQEQASK